MANNGIVNSLTFTGAVVGSATIQAQSVAGNLTFLLPNQVPTALQILTAQSVNGNVVSLGWSAPQSAPSFSSITGSLALSQIAQGGATVGQALEWSGSAWAPATLSGAGVSSVFTRTGAVVALAGDYSAFYLPIATVLPATKAAVTSNFLTSYTSGTGLFTAAQPAYTDISGTPTPSGTTSTVASANANLTSAAIGTVLQADGSGNVDGSSGLLVTNVASKSFVTSQGYITSSALTPYALLAGAAFTDTVTITGASANPALTVQSSSSPGQDIADFKTAGGSLAVQILHTGDLWPRFGIQDSASSTGTSGQVLTAGTGDQLLWATPSSATPGGSSGDIQYNNSGAFGGSAATITGAGSITIPSGQILTVQDIENQVGHQLSISAIDASNIAINGASSSQIILTSTGAITLTTATTNAITLATATGSFQFFGTGGGMSLATANASIAIDSSGDVIISTATGSANMNLSASGLINLESATQFHGKLVDVNGGSGAANYFLSSNGGSSTVLWSPIASTQLSDTASLAYQMDGTGTAPAAGDNHIASGTGAIITSGNVTISLTGSAVFADTNYVVQVTRTNAVTGIGQLFVTIISGSQFNVASSDNTDTTSTFNWTAIGY